jgi:hypothetical protein
MTADEGGISIMCLVFDALLAPYFIGATRKNVSKERL